MDKVFYEGQVLWAQIDANRHLRHSAYADMAAQARLGVLDRSGFDARVLTDQKIGPILFREELIYFREIGLNDTVKVTCALTKCHKDGSLWSFTQDIFRGDGVKAALVNTDGAWINTETRKLTGLPVALFERFKQMPLSKDFIME